MIHIVPIYQPHTLEKQLNAVIRYYHKLALLHCYTYLYEFIAAMSHRLYCMLLIDGHYAMLLYILQAFLTAPDVGIWKHSGAAAVLPMAGQELREETR